VALNDTKTYNFSAILSLLPDTDGIVYAALDLGHFGAKLWRRDPTGSWRELPVPAFPPKPEDAGDDPHPWSLGKIWVLEPGGVPGRVWAGTMPGGFFRTDDGGESWSLNEALWPRPGVQCRRVWLRQSQRHLISRDAADLPSGSEGGMGGGRRHCMIRMAPRPL